MMAKCVPGYKEIALQHYWQRADSAFSTERTEMCVMCSSEFTKLQHHYMYIEYVDMKQGQWL